MAAGTFLVAGLSSRLVVLSLIGTSASGSGREAATSLAVEARVSLTASLLILLEGTSASIQVSVSG